MRTCAFDTCDRPAHTALLCHSHYEMKRRRGVLQPLFSERRPSGAALIRDSEGRKQCKRCKLWKSPDEFTVHSPSLDGLKQQCRECRAEIRAANKGKLAAKRYRMNFNISLLERDAMLKRQGGVCEICGTADPGKRGWTTDHDHACCSKSATSCGGCIRGILCGRCNMALGQVNDSTEILQSMIDYLNSNSAQRLAA